MCMTISVSIWLHDPGDNTEGYINYLYEAIEEMKAVEEEGWCRASYVANPTICVYPVSRVPV